MEITCKDTSEANYLALAIINSDVLAESVNPLMSKGQFGARDLHKHLWKLPIPEFDAGVELHVDIAARGVNGGRGCARERLAALREERGADVGVTDRAAGAAEVAAGVGGRARGGGGGGAAAGGRVGRGAIALTLTLALHHKCLFHQKSVFHSTSTTRQFKLDKS